MADLARRDRSPLSRQNFLEAIGAAEPEDAFPDDWSPEDKTIGALALTQKPIGSKMYSKIPRVCPGKCCDDWEHKRCTLPKVPEGDRCPHEVLLLEALLVAFVDNLNVSDDDITTFSLIRDLVDTEIAIVRSQGQFAIDPKFVVEQAIVAEGEVVGTMYIENPMLGAQDKLMKRKATILKQLAATREAKLKLIGDATNKSEIHRVAEVMARVAAVISEKGYVDKHEDDYEYVDAFIDGDPEDVTEIDDPEE